MLVDPQNSNDVEIAVGWSTAGDTVIVSPYSALNSVSTADLIGTVEIAIRYDLVDYPLILTYEQDLATVVITNSCDSVDGSNSLTITGDDSFLGTTVEWGSQVTVPKPVVTDSASVAAGIDNFCGEYIGAISAIEINGDGSISDARRNALVSEDDDNYYFDFSDVTGDYVVQVAYSIDNPNLTEEVIAYLDVLEATVESPCNIDNEISIAVDGDHLPSGSEENRPWTYSIVQGTIVYGDSAPLEEFILPTFTNTVAETVGDPYFCGQYTI
jgi:hypothetical protein